MKRHPAIPAEVFQRFGARGRLLGAIAPLHASAAAPRQHIRRARAAAYTFSRNSEPQSHSALGAQPGITRHMVHSMFVLCTYYNLYFHIGPRAIPSLWLDFVRPRGLVGIAFVGSLR